MAKRLSLQILIGLVLGVAVGWGVNLAIADGSPAGQARLADIAGYLSLITTVFLRLIKMIIAPLVFATLAAGIAHMSDTSALGRIAMRSLGWFIGASLVSLTLGLLLVNLFQPGAGLEFTPPAAPAAAGGVERGAFNLADFITHIVPASMIEAMAKNEILQIVVFSIFVGVAITAVGKRAAPIVRGVEALVAVMLQITEYVMRFAPVAVFSAVAAAIAERGPAVLGTLGHFLGLFYVGLVLLCLLLFGAAYLIVGGRAPTLIRCIREPMLLAFSTASSEAVYPRMLEALSRFGVPRRIASFVLPLGYSFNLDGSMMYMTFATLFIAQAYGMDLGLSQQVVLLLVLMVTSKGVAGVPRASLVVVAATIPIFDIPEEGLLLIIAIDHFLDMGRTATNVVGNAVACAAIAKWEGVLVAGEAADPKESAAATCGERLVERRGRRMRKSIGMVFLAASVLCSSAAISAQAERKSQGARSAAENAPSRAALIDPIFNRWSHKTPGCAVGVAQDGQPDLLRAYGASDLEHAVLNTSSSVFEAGSVSKQFTAAGILLLAQQGKLTLTDDVRKYIPSLPDYGQVITINHLLNHTSGLRDWGAIVGAAGWPRSTRAYTMNDVLGVITRQRALNFRPGEHYSYTNSGYNLLVMIAEKVTAQSFAKWSRENLFEPLGLARTQWRDSFRRVVEQRAIAYTRTPDGYMQLMPFEDAYGNGGLLTTVGDLLKWNKALDGGRLGSVVTSGLQERGLLNSGRRIAYARGLVVSTYRGTPEIAHSGSTAGYRAWLGRYPEQQHLSIALLCNSTEAEALALGHRIVDAVLTSSPLQPVLSPIALGAKRAAALAGTFVDERNGMLMKLENVEGRLVVPRGSELEAISESRFRMKDAILEFDGPDAFDLQNGEGPAVKYRRAASYSPSPAELAGFAGTYVSDEADATFVVTVKEGRLVMTLQDRPTQTFELTPAYPQAFATPDNIVIFRGDSAGGHSKFHLGLDRVWDLAFRRANANL